MASADSEYLTALGKKRSALRSWLATMSFSSLQDVSTCTGSSFVSSSGAHPAQYLQPINTGRFQVNRDHYWQVLDWASVHTSMARYDCCEMFMLSGER